jgi:hypothetical protein
MGRGGITALARALAVAHGLTVKRIMGSCRFVPLSFGWAHQPRRVEGRLDNAYMLSAGFLSQKLTRRIMRRFGFEQWEAALDFN